LKCELVDEYLNVTRLQTTDSTAGDLLDLEYHYNSINNRTSLVDNTASVEYNYYYDALGRLTLG